MPINPTTDPTGYLASIMNGPGASAPAGQSQSVATPAPAAGPADPEKDPMAYLTSLPAQAPASLQAPAAGAAPPHAAAGGPDLSGIDTGNSADAWTQLALTGKQTDADKLSYLKRHYGDDNVAPYGDDNYALRDSPTGRWYTATNPNVGMLHPVNDSLHPLEWLKKVPSYLGDAAEGIGMGVGGTLGASTAAVDGPLAIPAAALGAGGGGATARKLYQGAVSTITDPFGPMSTAGLGEQAKDFAVNAAVDGTLHGATTLVAPVVAGAFGKAANFAKGILDRTQGTADAAPMADSAAAAMGEPGMADRSVAENRALSSLIATGEVPPPAAMMGQTGLNAAAALKATKAGDLVRGDERAYVASANNALNDMATGGRSPQQLGASSLDGLTNAITGQSDATDQAVKDATNSLYAGTNEAFAAAGDQDATRIVQAHKDLATPYATDASGMPLNPAGNVRNLDRQIPDFMNASRDGVNFEPTPPAPLPASPAGPAPAAPAPVAPAAADAPAALPKVPTVADANPLDGPTAVDPAVFRAALRKAGGDITKIDPADLQVAAPKAAEPPAAPAAPALLDPAPQPSAPADVAPPSSAPALVDAPPPALPAAPTVSDQVSRQAVAAGRGAEEGQALGDLSQSYYDARAARFGGARGTAEDLYAHDGPTISGYGDAPRPLDPTRPSTRMQEDVEGYGDDAPRGYIDLAQNGKKAAIQIARDGADASTVPHELSHAWLEDITNDAAHPDATPEAKQLAQDVHDFLGTSQEDVIPAEAHEQFASAFEDYLHTGRAPTARLASAFERFKGWIRSVYESVGGRAKVDPQIADVFDRMLGKGRPAAESQAETAAGSATARDARVNMGASLPRDLAGMQPRFGYGKSNFHLDFESDLDRAAYAVRNRENPSKRDADLMSFVRQNTGLSEEGARSYGDEVAAAIKEKARTAPSDAARLNVPQRGPTTLFQKRTAFNRLKTGDYWQGYKGWITEPSARKALSAAEADYRPYGDHIGPFAPGSLNDSLSKTYREALDEAQARVDKFDNPDGHPVVKAGERLPGRRLTAVPTGAGRYLVGPAGPAGAVDDFQARLHMPPAGGYDPSRPISEQFTRKPMSTADMGNDGEGNYETKMLETGPRHLRKGAATDMYDALPAYTGHEARPSGHLLDDGYRFWSKRDPESVQYHRQTGSSSWFSPRKIKVWNDLAQRKIGPLLPGKQQDVDTLKAAWDSIPDEGKTPEAMRRMFQSPATSRPRIAVEGNGRRDYLSDDDLTSRIAGLQRRLAVEPPRGPNLAPLAADPLAAAPAPARPRPAALAGDDRDAAQERLDYLQDKQGALAQYLDTGDAQGHRVLEPGYTYVNPRHWDVHPGADGTHLPVRTHEQGQGGVEGEIHATPAGGYDPARAPSDQFTRGPIAKFGTMQEDDKSWQLGDVDAQKGDYEPSHEQLDRLHDAIESKMGVKLTAPSQIRAEDVDYWRKRDPEAVASYVPHPSNGGLESPANAARREDMERAFAYMREPRRTWTMDDDLFPDEEGMEHGGAEDHIGEPPPFMAREPRLGGLAAAAEPRLGGEPRLGMEPRLGAEPRMAMEPRLGGPAAEPRLGMEPRLGGEPRLGAEPRMGMEPRLGRLFQSRHPQAGPPDLPPAVARNLPADQGVRDWYGHAFGGSKATVNPLELADFDRNDFVEGANQGNMGPINRVKDANRAVLNDALDAGGFQATLPHVDGPFTDIKAASAPLMAFGKQVRDLTGGAAPGDLANRLRNAPLTDQHVKDAVDMVKAGRLSPDALSTLMANRARDAVTARTAAGPGPSIGAFTNKISGADGADEAGLSQALAISNFPELAGRSRLDASGPIPRVGPDLPNASRHLTGAHPDEVAATGAPGQNGALTPERQEELARLVARERAFAVVSEGSKNMGKALAPSGSAINEVGHRAAFSHMVGSVGKALATGHVGYMLPSVANFAAFEALPEVNARAFSDRLGTARQLLGQAADASAYRAMLRGGGAGGEGHVGRLVNGIARTFDPTTRSAMYAAQEGEGAHMEYLSNRLREQGLNPDPGEYGFRGGTIRDPSRYVLDTSRAAEPGQQFGAANAQARADAVRSDPGALAGAMYDTAMNRVPGHFVTAPLGYLSQQRRQQQSPRAH